MTTSQQPQENQTAPVPSAPPPYYYAPYPPAPEPRNGLGLTSLILGILALVLAFVPFETLISAPAGVVGLTLGLSNIGRLRRHTATNRLSTIFGCVLSALGIILGIIVVVAL